MWPTSCGGRHWQGAFERGDACDRCRQGGRRLGTSNFPKSLSLIQSRLCIGFYREMNKNTRLDFEMAYLLLNMVYKILAFWD